MRNRKLDRSREERKEKKKKNLEEGRMTVSESGETKKKKKKIPSSRLWKANQNRLETHQIVSD